MRSLCLQSAAGKLGSQRLLLETVRDLQLETRRNQRKLFEQAVVYKMEGEIELARRRRFGLSEADMIPHPDHLIIEPMTGKVILRGPFTPDEKAIVDQLVEARAGQEAEILRLQRRLRRSPRDPDIIDMIETGMRLIALIDSRMPPDRILVEGGGD